MAKKKKKKSNDGITTIYLTVHIEDEEPVPSAADVFIYKFFETLSWWVLGFVMLIPIALILSI